MTVGKDQVLPVLLSIAVIIPAVFLGSLIPRPFYFPRPFYLGLLLHVIIGQVPAMLAAALISYRWPGKFWRVAPAMTLTLLAWLLAETLGKRKSAFWDIGFYYVCFLIVPYFLASVIGCWLRMRVDSRSERESEPDALGRS